ncbi:hypothetical protein NUW54_g4241 [Trametes sanguinea]|uniref:Uncharacterized protein n=1 Tax=Trametes sanguinea TaxID=158606 RepID=A0ACC1PYH3_9APHY|nr:hypothetical protein NUW54_g4241 [Trametes sanguinea]
MPLTTMLEGTSDGPFTMSKALFISLLASLTARSIVSGQATGLAPKKFLNVPLGKVKPAGWLRDQLVVQANGLAGHEHDFYDYVAQSDWIGGNSYYSNLEEAGSYWFNGMVPNGVLLDDPKIMAQTHQFLDYVLDHQDSTGWLGPEVNTTKPRYLWGRYPFFFGAIQMVEANSSLADRVVPALHKFVALANTMLHNGEGLEDWTRTRWEDFVIVLQWLYDFYPEGKEELLIDTMKMLKYTGDPWEDVFNEQYFPQEAVENLKNPFPVLTWHGVNMAEGLKALPSTYRFTHNQSGGPRCCKQGLGLAVPVPWTSSGIYLLACARNGIQPTEAVFLDDLGMNLKAAQALGMETIPGRSSLPSGHLPSSDNVDDRDLARLSSRRIPAAEVRLRNAGALRALSPTPTWCASSVRGRERWAVELERLVRRGSVVLEVSTELGKVFRHGDSSAPENEAFADVAETWDIPRAPWTRTPA